MFETNERHDYPRAPALIQSCWETLAPAIVEISYHHTEKDVNLDKSLRDSIREILKTNKTIINKTAVRWVSQTWLSDLFILLGTLPLEASEISDTAKKRSLLRYTTGERGEINADLSYQTRCDAMACIEMLSAKAWYSRNINNKGQDYIIRKIIKNLEFLYWECGIPFELLNDSVSNDSLSSEFYNDLRALNYRQLYELEAHQKVSDLVANVNAGRFLLEEKRLSTSESLIRKKLYSDYKWAITLKDALDHIKEKYKYEEYV